ncbi:MAG: RdgB/HAM1 family non-canonical purine NTP pyrophosphatase [Chthoniobacteraceae bacterium]
MPNLLIATKNAHKTQEIQAMLGSEWSVTDLNEHPEVAAPDETGETFEENAEIKAVAASQMFAGFVLSDDSGLEVDALDGAPGVRSARYSGDAATDASNRAKLLQELERAGARGKERSARFRCAMALAEHGKVLATFDGAVEGMIINQEKGEGGFGYDSLFVPDGHCETFAQLPAAVKNVLSHRARALTRARQFLEGAAAAKTPPRGTA